MVLSGYADENPMETPIVRYSAVSSIENSHKAAITDLLWIPDHMELNRMGVPQESRSGQCAQVGFINLQSLKLYIQMAALV